MSKNRKTIKEKIKDLESLGYYIEEIRGGEYVFSWEKKNANNPLYIKIRGFPSTKIKTISKRDLSKIHKEKFQKGVAYKKVVKKLSGGQDRAAERAVLSKDNYDAIPSKQPIQKEDVWGWD